MSLHFILGSPGTGKSTKLRQDLIRSAMAHPDKKHIMLVPEQFTMQTQRDVVEAHPRHAVMNIEVLSFERMAYRLLENRLSHLTILSETGKNMLLRQAAGQAGDEIRLFRRSLKRGGFISHLMSMMSEFYQYGVTEEDLQKMEGELTDHPLLLQKVSELRAFYHALNQTRGDETIAAEELLTLLARELQTADRLKGCVIAMDHFTGFTPVQRKILSELIRQAESVSAALILPREEDTSGEIREGDLFYMSRMACLQMEQMAKAAGVPVTREYLETPHRFSEHPDLAFLMRHYLRYGVRESFTEVPESVSCHILRNPRAEAEWTAGRIRRLVREEGLRYREIAVVTGNLEEYRPLLRTAFREAEIPAFLDRKKGILGNPLVEYLRSALMVPESRFSYDSVFRFLRCGISVLNRTEIDALDLYVSAAGIRGKRRWTEEWVRIPDPARPADPEAVNRSRQRVMDVLSPLLLLAERRDACVQDYVDAMEQMMLQADAEQRMEEMGDRCDEEGEPELAEECRRVCRYLHRFFRQMSGLLGNQKTNRREFLEILDAGLSEAKLGLLPSGLDLVQIGDVRRSRLTGVKVLFVLGMNEGRIPGKPAEGGILSEWERELLRRHELELAPTAEETAGQDRFYLYMLLTRPSQRLILTAVRMDGSGAAERTSYLLEQLFRLFPALTLSEEDPDRELSGPVTAWRTAAAGIRDYAARDREEAFGKDAFGALLWELARQKDGRRMEWLLSEAFPGYRGMALKPETAEAVYGNEITGSISRLECYASCAARQFFRYGLDLSERVYAELSPADRGNFFHHILETFFAVCREKERDVLELSEEERTEALRTAIQRVSGEERVRQMSEDSAAGGYRYHRWERLADRAVWAICELLSQGEFRPEFFEWTFSGWTNPALAVELEEGVRMVLHGVVDRIDACEIDGERYVRILDYKTGSKTFDLSEIYEGLSLQLILYLEAVLETERLRRGNRPVHPGGVYYYPVKEEQVDAPRGADEGEIRRQLLKQWRPQGLSNSRKELKEALGQTKGTGVTEEQFGLLGSYVREKTASYGRSLRGGDISAYPFRRKDQTACDYCPYRSVCGFDPRREGYHYRRIREWKDKDVWVRLKKREEGEG